MPTKTNKNIAAQEQLDQLKAKLRELFQLDRGDLDFGLYRVMALKTAEVNNFLDNHLLPQVDEALGDIANSDSSLLQKEINDMRQMAKMSGNPPDPEIKELTALLQAARNDEQTVADTYNHLCSFFTRYYNDGDFMSLRRYKSAGKDAYAIPYNGEEVMLHWANRDQYYIKTTENYSSYVFIVNRNGTESRVRFQITAADNEKDNIKPTNGNQRFFMLAKDAIAIKDDELIIRFDHRPLTAGEKTLYPKNGTKRQDAINKNMATRLVAKLEKQHGDWLAPLSEPCPTTADPTRTVLAKHLTAYTAKNSFDYFIHKDLGSFLRRELDYYLKSEVLSIDNLELTDDPLIFLRSLRQTKAIRRIGNKIIDLLAQLENFQKQLWLKKKMVLETHYCVTLDKVPEALYEEVAKNKAQHEEWLNLYAIDEINGDLTSPAAYSKQLAPAFLKQNPYLVLDTKHFAPSFVDKLLAALSETGPIDEQLNGLLVHGENFQALNLLQERYREQVKCVYIDPPYNTDASAILYKNGYKDSSWLSLIEDRLKLAHSVLQNDGIVCVAIDDEEVSLLRTIMSNIFTVELGVVTVCSNPRGRKTKDRFAPAHEYALFYGKTDQATPGALEKTEEQMNFYPHEDERGRFTWLNFIRSGTNNRRQDRPKLFYPIFVNNKNKIRIPEMEWNENSREWVLQEHNLEDEVIVYPIRETNGEFTEGNWHRGHQRVTEEIGEHRVRRIQKNTHVSIQFKARMDEAAKPKTWWKKSSYQSATGTMQLKAIHGDKEFDFPKSIDLVKDCIISSASDDANANILDYFAGSGTTGHAVINLNREDNGNRKYILVEVGHHFDTVLLPRIKKVIYSKDWKDGKPKERQGVSQLLRYIRLESYEDTMDSLQVKSRNDLFANIESKAMAEDYQLRYALGEETAESASLAGKHFTNPSQYTLSVVRDGVRRDVNVDLAETFNFLLGLRLTSRRRIDDVLAITGTTARGDNCLILWRDIKKVNATKLDKWFAKHRKTFDNDLASIYVNGDHTLNTFKTPTSNWQAVTIEPVLRKLMFEASDG